MSGWRFLKCLCILTNPYLVTLLGSGGGEAAAMQAAGARARREIAAVLSEMRRPFRRRRHSRSA